VNLRDWLVASGPALALGSAIVLAIGVLFVVVARDPAARRRAGGLALWATAGYFALALLPLPRWSLPRWSLPRASAPEPASTPATVEDAALAAPPDLQALLAALPPASPRTAPSASGAANVRNGLDAAPAAPAAATESPAPTAVPFAAALPIAFAAGAALSAFWLLLGVLRLHRIVARSTPAPAALVRAARLPPTIDVRIATLPVRPFCCGLLRPRIVLPPDLARPTPAALAVLRHEWAHLRAGDVRLQAVMALLQPLLFWQPLFWWLRRQVRFCSELLADAEAAQTGVHDYVRAMLDLFATPTPRLAAPLASTVFHRPSEFYRRLHMLLARERPLSASPSRWLRALHGAGAAGVTVACALALGARPLAAQEPAQDPASELRVLRDLVADLRKEIADLRATAEAAPHENDEYVVQKGDSIEGILRGRLGRRATPEDTARFKQLNPDVLPDRLRVGQKVRVPRRGGYWDAMGGQHNGAWSPFGVHGQQPAANAPDNLQWQWPSGAAPDLTWAPFGVQGQPPAGGAPQDPMGAPAGGFPNADPLQRPGGGQPPAGPLTQNPFGGYGNVDPASARLTDLITAVTRCIELRGDVEVAELEFAELDQRAAAGTTTTLERDRARVRVRVKKQQLAAVVQILKGQLELAQQELQRLEKLHEAGVVSDTELGRARNFVDVLKGPF